MRVAEVQLKVLRDVIDDAAGFRDVRVAGVAHGLEAHAAEAEEGVLQREAVLD